MDIKKILIVEDESDIRDLIKYNLEKHGFQVDGTGSGTGALQKIRVEKYGLILLDIMLPGIDGLEILQVLKSDPAFSEIPVIILSARSEETDKLRGIEFGADDYVTKPFSPRELVARAKGVLRCYAARTERQAEEWLIQSGPLVIDTRKYLVTKGGHPVELSPMEFMLLAYLAKRPGKIIKRDFLLDEVWGGETCIEPRTIDVHIRRLREKIEDNPSVPEFIRTKRGVGYYFTDHNTKD